MSQMPVSYCKSSFLCVQVQFHAKGPTGAALISADMYQDAAKQWQYAFLFVDVTNPTPQRLVLIGPQY